MNTDLKKAHSTYGYESKIAKVFNLSDISTYISPYALTFSESRQYLADINHLLPKTNCNK